MNPLKIIKYIRQHQITKIQFCKLCNITISTLDNIVYYGNMVDYTIIERISNAMGIGIYELYKYDY